MKLKAAPGDFIVKERSALSLSPAPGPYRVYRLKKRQWDSFDLVDLLARRWHVMKSDISLSGRKDRHGESEQFLAVRSCQGLPPAYEAKGFSLVHAGFSDRKLSAACITGNSFRLTLRDLRREETDLVKRNCRTVRTAGFPNYFDEQRLGSARAGRGFPGKALFLGRMEEAFKIFLAPDGHESAAERQFKKEARAVWRQWNKITAPVPRRYAAAFRVLNAPGGYMAFNKAVNALDREQLIMALQAYQSHLFNRVAVYYVKGLADAGRLELLPPFPTPYGDVLFYDAEDERVLMDLQSIELPVPGHDTVTDHPPVQTALERTLKDEGITLPDLKVKKLHGKAVRGVERRLVVVPEEFAFDEPTADELYPEKMKMVLYFFLPRGSYATMLVKRIQSGPSLRPGRP